MEGKTREWAEEVRTVRDVYVRVDYSSAEHGSVAVVGRSASGRQDRSGARRHGCHDRGELLDLHVASEGEWCEQGVTEGKLLVEQRANECEETNEEVVIRERKWMRGR